MWGKSVGAHLPFLLGISHIMCLKAYERGNAATYFNFNNKTNWTRVGGVEGWYYWHHASFHTTRPHEILSCLPTPLPPCKAHFTHETESPWPLHFKHSHWWKRRVRSKFASHYAWGTTAVCECKMDGRVYMDPYMASNGSCFMVTWTIFKYQILEVGLTQNCEIMALWRLTIIDVFYFIMCEGPHE